MSIIHTKVQDSQFTQGASYIGASKFIYATIDPNTAQNLPFPTDYKFGKCFLPEKYAKFAARIHDFEVRADDIWIVAFPKTGTTWVQNIVWQLKNNLNFEAEAIRPWFQLIEYSTMFDITGEQETFQRLNTDSDSDIEKYEKLPSPRILKSHLPAPLLPKRLWTVKPKIIYMARNPKDVALSFFHYRRKHDFSVGTIDESLERFLNDHVPYSPFYDHILGFWQLRHFDNVLFMTYEKMSADQFGGVKRISEFLECSYSDEQLQQLTKHVSFENLKKIRPDPDFEHCRKGKVGGFRDEMNGDFIKRFDEWTKEKLKDSNFGHSE